MAIMIMLYESIEEFREAPTETLQKCHFAAVKKDSSTPTLPFYTVIKDSYGDFVGKSVQTSTMLKYLTGKIDG